MLGGDFCDVLGGLPSSGGGLGGQVLGDVERGRERERLGLKREGERERLETGERRETGERGRERERERERERLKRD